MVYICKIQDSYYYAHKLGNKYFLAAIPQGESLGSESAVDGSFNAEDTSSPMQVPSMPSSSMPKNDMGMDFGDIDNNSGDGEGLVIDPSEVDLLDKIELPGIKSEYIPILEGMKIIDIDKDNSLFGVEFFTTDHKKAIGAFILLTGYLPKKEEKAKDGYKFYGTGDLEYLPRSVFKSMDGIEKASRLTRAMNSKTASHSLLGKLHTAETTGYNPDDVDTLAIGMSAGMALERDKENLSDESTDDLPEMGDYDENLFDTEMPSIDDSMDTDINSSVPTPVGVDYIVELTFNAGVSSVLNSSQIRFGKKEISFDMYDSIQKWVATLDEDAQIMLLSAGVGEGCVITGEDFDIVVKAESVAPLGKIVLTFKEPEEAEALPELGDNTDELPENPVESHRKISRIKKSNNYVQRAIGEGITTGQMRLEINAFPTQYDIPLLYCGNKISFNKEPLSLMTSVKDEFDLRGKDSMDYNTYITNKYTPNRGFARELGVLGGISTYFLGYMDRMNLLLPESAFEYSNWYGFYYPKNTGYSIANIVRHRSRLEYADMLGSDILTGKNTVDKFIITDYIFYQRDENTVSCLVVVYTLDEDSLSKADRNGNGQQDFSEIQNLKYLVHWNNDLDLAQLQNVPKQSMWKILDRFCKLLYGRGIAVLKDWGSAGFMKDYPVNSFDMKVSRRDSKRPSELAEEGKHSHTSPDNCPRYDLRGVEPKRHVKSPSEVAVGLRRTSGPVSKGITYGLVAGLVGAYMTYKKSDKKIKEIQKSYQKPYKSQLGYSIFN